MSNIDGIRISSLPDSREITDNDYVIIEQADGTRKANIQTINKKTNDTMVSLDKKIVDVTNSIKESNVSLDNTINKVSSIDTKVVETEKSITALSSQMEDIANKGTTVEVLERVTKEEIDRQIADGTISNLTIEDGSINREKCKLGLVGLKQLDTKIQALLYPPVYLNNELVVSKYLSVSTSNNSLIVDEPVTVTTNFKVVKYGSIIEELNFKIGECGDFFIITNGDKFISINLTCNIEVQNTPFIGVGIDNSVFNLLIHNGDESGISPNYTLSKSLDTINVKLEGSNLTIQSTRDGLNYNKWFNFDLDSMSLLKGYYEEGLFGHIYGGSNHHVDKKILATNIKFVSRSLPSTVEEIVKDMDIVYNTNSSVYVIEKELDMSISRVTTTQLTNGSSNRNSYFQNRLDEMEAVNAFDFRKDIIFLPKNALRFKVKRHTYWIVLGGNEDEYSLLGLSTKYRYAYNSGSIYNESYTHQMTNIINGIVEIPYPAYSFTDKIGHVQLDLDDEVEIVNGLKSIEVSVKCKNSSKWINWFNIQKNDFPLTKHFSDDTLGFNFGVSLGEIKGYDPENNHSPVSILNTKVLFSDLCAYSGSRLKNIEDKLEELHEIVKNPVYSEPSKYAIVCVAGQSNAVGYDESPVNGLFEGRINPRVKQLGFKGSNNLKIVPLTHCAENFQDLATSSFTNHSNVNTSNLGTKGIHAPLGDLVSKYLPSDYNVLIIPCAYGATGFNSGNIGTYDSVAMKPSTGQLQWGVASPYYTTMRDRIKYALDLNSENIFLGVVWIQGENDSTNPQGHLTGFTTMTDDFFNYFNTNGYSDRVKKGTFDKNIWFNVETVAYWYSVGQCTTIWDNYKSWNNNTYIKIPRETESNIVNGTDSTSSIRTSHFGNNAFSEVVAPRVCEKIKNNI